MIHSPMSDNNEGIHIRHCINSLELSILSDPLLMEILSDAYSLLKPSQIIGNSVEQSGTQC
jgi:hypothetical protein